MSITRGTYYGKENHAGDKPMGICPFCGDRPKKKMTGRKKEGKYSELQKCQNGHIWRSLYSDGEKLDLT